MRTLGGVRYPATRSQVLAAATRKEVEGWDVHFFATRALKRARYADLRSVMVDLEDWLALQG